jgi:hypothetical protein
MIKKRFNIPVIITICGSISVEAKDLAEAVELAKKEYDKNPFDYKECSIESPCVDIDFLKEDEEDDEVEEICEPDEEDEKE